MRFLNKNVTRTHDLNGRRTTRLRAVLPVKGFGAF